MSGVRRHQGMHVCVCGRLGGGMCVCVGEDYIIRWRGVVCVGAGLDWVEECVCACMGAGVRIVCPGEVIIATNLAGRGTDIKVTDAVNASGLLCLMTFVARNRRVELQAFGRTALGGKPGSVQYAFSEFLTAEKESIRLL